MRRGRVLGTGYGTYGTASDFVFLNTFNLVDDEAEVNVYAINNPGGAPSVQSLGQMVCDDNAGPGVYRLRHTGLKELADASEGEATARCRNGESVVGGAAYNQGVYADEAYVTSSGPVDLGDADKLPDDGWRAEVNNNADGSGDTIQIKPTRSATPSTTT